MTWRRRRRRLAVHANSEVHVTLPEAVALHARPAANFVRTAMRFRSHVTVGVNGRVADAKSILAVLALGATGGALLRPNAEGEGAPAAVGAAAAFVCRLARSAVRPPSARR